MKLKYIIDTTLISHVMPDFSYGRNTGLSDDDSIKYANVTHNFMEIFFDTYIPYKIYIYELSEEDGGGFGATIPKLSGCMSDGETEYDAFINVLDAMKGWVETTKALGRKVQNGSVD